MACDDRARARSFWSAVVCSSLLCIVKQTGERSLALYLHDDLQLSTSAAASVASVWPIGFMVSIIGLGAIFDMARQAYSAVPERTLCRFIIEPHPNLTSYLDRRAAEKVRMVLGMTGCSTAAMFLIGAWQREPGTEATNGEIVGKIALIFVAAVGIGLPFYVPLGVYTVQFGKRRAGVVSAYLDAVSAAVTAMFLWVLSGTVGSGSWSLAWLQLGGIGLLMTYATTRFVRRLYGPSQDWELLFDD